MLDRKRICLAVAIAVIAVAAVPADAHHGGGVEWQDEVRGPVTGTATEFEFRFPHVVLRLNADEPDGSKEWAMVTRWTPTILRRMGWTRNSIEPGDAVTVTYRPHVSDPAIGYMQSIEVNGEPLPLD